jgi:hypothetical protein
MVIRSLGDAFDKTRAAVRFATTVQRRMSLTNEASAAGRVPGELVQDAYAQAIEEIAPVDRSAEAGSILKLPTAQRMKPAG